MTALPAVQPKHVKATVQNENFCLRHTWRNTWYCLARETSTATHTAADTQADLVQVMKRRECLPLCPESRQTAESQLSAKQGNPGCLLCGSAWHHGSSCQGCRSRCCLDPHSRNPLDPCSHCEWLCTLPRLDICPDHLLKAGCQQSAAKGILTAGLNYPAINFMALYTAY